LRPQPSWLRPGGWRSFSEWPGYCRRSSGSDPALPASEGVNLGYWGVKSYENDDADDALDAGFERVHGKCYEQFMDDRNPLSFEPVQKRLADGRTLTASVEALEELIEAKLTGDPEAWDDAARLAFAGIVVRHAELGVAIPEELRLQAIQWLQSEDISWDSPTRRKLRREKELAQLHRLGAHRAGPDRAN
jgi:hypothetical protein